jgi:hypothetical protein
MEKPISVKRKNAENRRRENAFAPTVFCAYAFARPARALRLPLSVLTAAVFVLGTSHP